jgi:copper resistance protein C
MRFIPMVFAAFLASTGAAGAHATLERATPRVGSTVASAPTEVSASFTERLEPSFSTMVVLNAAGEEVSVPPAGVSGNVLRVKLKALPPGTYRVRWRVLSVDTHRTQGEFSFRVGQ